jgi:CBS domain-containing protein
MKCPSCGRDNLPGADECVGCQGSLMQEDVPQPNTPVEHSIMVDPISTLHPPAPQCVSHNASLAEVVRQMRETNIGYVLVTDDDRRLVGIFTERDLLMKVAGQITDLDTVKVFQLMTPNPTALRASEPINHALFLMAHNGFRHIPLVDEENRPQAITSVRHLVQYIEQISPQE